MMLYELFVLPLDRRLLKGREFVSQFTVAPLVPRTVSGTRRKAVRDRLALQGGTGDFP